MQTVHEQFVPAKREAYVLYQCDFCDFSRRGRRAGDFGNMPIDQCDACGQDICPHDTTCLYDPLEPRDFDVRYPAIVSCPRCLDLVTTAWNRAQDIARRGDLLRDVAHREIKQLQKSVAKCDDVGYDGNSCKYVGPRNNEDIKERRDGT